jgi:hypothetical protein
VLRGQLLVLAVLAGELDAIAAEQLAMSLQPGDARALEETGDAERRLLHDLCAALLHGRDVEVDAADLHAVHGELVLRAMEQLGGLQQRFGRNAARVEARAAERVGAVLVLPLVDAGDLELVLAGADCAGITGGATADDDHIVLGCHTGTLLMEFTAVCRSGFSPTPICVGAKAPTYKIAYNCSKSRAGSSSASLIATRNCTDSRPSTMR